MSHHWVNNKCNRVKGQCQRWLIYALRKCLLCNNMLRVFRSNRHCSWNFHKFHGKTLVLESLFFLRMMKLYKYNCSAWISPTSAKNWLTSLAFRKYNRSVILWRTLLWIFRKWFMKTSKKKKKKKIISQQIFIYIYSSHYAYIPQHTHKTLPTLGNEKKTIAN